MGNAFLFLMRLGADKQGIWRGRLSRGLLAVLLSVIGSGLAVGAGTPEAAAESSERLPGLRFKSGPVCMCNGGLSEADIRRAERRGSGGLPKVDESRKRTDHEEE